MTGEELIVVGVVLKDINVKSSTPGQMMTIRKPTERLARFSAVALIIK